MRAHPYTTFRGAFCARCGKKHDVKAKTHTGAITKATLECNGIIMTSKGPVATKCAGPGMGELAE